MHTFQSGGTTIRIHQTEPAGPGPFPALLLLHGAGGNVDFWLDRVAPQLTRLGIAVYAVHYFDRTGTVRADTATILDGHHFPLWLSTVSDALSYIAQRPQVDARRIALLGISLGAFLSLALGTENRMIRAIVEISGGLPAPWDAHASASYPPTLVLHGESDTVVPVALAHALDRKLTELSVPHQTLLLPAEGHWFSAGAQLRILAATAAFLGRFL